MHTRNTYMILLILSGLAVCSNGGNSNNSSNDTNSAAESAAPEEDVFDLLVGDTGPRLVGGRHGYGGEG